jgi:hypothetical protein
MVYDDSATRGGRLSEKQFFDNAVAYNNGSGTPTKRLLYTYDALLRVTTFCTFAYENSTLSAPLIQPLVPKAATSESLCLDG